MKKKKVVLGITSSISAYKACDLSRLFVKGGYDVHVVITENASKLVSTLTLEALTGNPVHTNETLWEKHEMGHINLKEGAALFLVAPATANIIGKFASGIADDIVSTTFLAMKCPVVLAPAMNPDMFSSRPVQENLKKLEGWGIKIIDPAEGVVACGDTGKGKLPEIEVIYREALNEIK